MPGNLAALEAAPFPEDQLTLIRRLIGDASADQLRWLSGYLAGYQAAGRPAPAPAAAAPPAPRPALTILYATESGNAEALAGAARKAAQRLGFAARALDMADTTPAQATQAGALLVIASTWGEGDPPQRAEAFYGALMEQGAPRFDGVRYAVLALGDRAYVNFCATGRAIDERLAALGGERIAPRVECDLDYATTAKSWIDGSLAALAPQTDPGAAVIHVDFLRPPASETADAPFAAEMTERINLNGTGSTAETWHVALSLEGSGLAYEPGDAIAVAPDNDPALVEEVLQTVGLGDDAALRAELSARCDITTLTQGQIAAYAALTCDAALGELAADAARAASFIRDRQLIDLLAAAPHRLEPAQLTGLVRPLPPRLYSVASSRAAVGEEVHLLISAVRWQSHGRARSGVASVDIADRRAPSDRLSVRVKPNPHFRLPDDPARPIVMIGPGTGVAPFRAFLQEREATGAAGRSWLFFGARNFTHDFLYQLEWQDWLRAGVLSRIDLAFSRDQREKIYVQQRMWEARRELYRWLADGAVIYVCGDAKAMAKDVHASLLRVIADQSGGDADSAAAWLRTAQQDGRYKRDVY